MAAGRTHRPQCRRLFTLFDHSLGRRLDHAGEYLWWAASKDCYNGPEWCQRTPSCTVRARRCPQYHHSADGCQLTSAKKAKRDMQMFGGADFPTLTLGADLCRIRLQGSGWEAFSVWILSSRPESPNLNIRKLELVVKGAAITKASCAELPSGTAHAGR